MITPVTISEFGRWPVPVGKLTGTSSITVYHHIRVEAMVRQKRREMCMDCRKPGIPHHGSIECQMHILPLRICLRLESHNRISWNSALSELRCMWDHLSIEYHGGSMPISLAHPRDHCGVGCRGATKHNVPIPFQGYPDRVARSRWRCRRLHSKGRKKRLWRPSPLQRLGRWNQMKPGRHRGCAPRQQIREIYREPLPCAPALGGETNQRCGSQNEL